MQRKSLKKKIALRLYQNWIFRNAACLHVNSVNEGAYFRAQGFKNPLAVLPVGVSVNSRALIGPNAARRIAEPLGSRRLLLYLSRVHPTKGVELLLRAWRDLHQRFPDWALCIAGGGDPKYVNALRGLIASSAVTGSVIMPGQVSNEEREWCYQNASCYVLPSYQENFGNTVAEALSHAVPVITTTGTPWTDLISHRCGWMCPPEAASLGAALQSALSMSRDQLMEMGARGAELIRERYAIDSVMSRLDLLYRWLLGGEAPKFLLK
jgi:glycosyltransferase involved in cell wall biosynthesis